MIYYSEKLQKNLLRVSFQTANMWCVLREEKITFSGNQSTLLKENKVTERLHGFRSRLKILYRENQKELINYFKVALNRTVHVLIDCLCVEYKANINALDEINITYLNWFMCCLKSKHMNHTQTHTHHVRWRWHHNSANKPVHLLIYYYIVSCFLTNSILIYV